MPPSHNCRRGRECGRGGECLVHHAKVLQNIDPLLNSNNEVTSVMLILLESEFDGTKTVDFAFSYSRDTALTELFYYIDRITIYIFN